MCSSSDCGESAGCARLASKVHVATKYNASTGICYAFVAYDANCSGAGSYMRSHLDIVDITNETLPTIAKTWIGGGLCGSGTNNTFGSVVTVNQFTNGMGWFYYQQASGNACSTTFTGWTNTALGLTTLTSTGTLGGPFPTMRFAAAMGLGDYVGIVQRGFPGGYLFPTWAQPVVTSASCVSCQAQQRSLATYGTRIHP